MNANDKNLFIIENLEQLLDEKSKSIKNLNKSYIKLMEKNRDFNAVASYLKEAIGEFDIIVDQWENSFLDELDGLSPMQYFESITDINILIDLFVLYEEKDLGVIPYTLKEKVLKLDDSSIVELNNKLKDICLEDKQSFDSMDKALLHIAEISGNPKLLDVLIEILKMLKEETFDDDYFILMDAIEVFGDKTLPPLIEILEKSDAECKQYMFALTEVGKIASKNRSEEIYRLLKDYFRKSETKVVEASALYLYGDGRAIPAIRGYVEKNLESITEMDYFHLRNAVLGLGGNMDDFDNYFDMDEFYEEDYDE